jgi:large subunit ribosomal protein L24
VGQIVEFPAPISVSNVKLICPKCNKSTRVSKEKEGRVCKKCNQKIQ